MFDENSWIRIPWGTWSNLCIPTPCPRPVESGLLGMRKGGRVSVFLPSIPGDLVLSVLRPSGVELGEGQWLDSNPVWCRGHYPGDWSPKNSLQCLCDSKRVWKVCAYELIRVSVKEAHQGSQALLMNSRPWQSSISVSITLELVRDVYSQDFPGGPAMQGHEFNPWSEN